MSRRSLLHRMDVSAPSLTPAPSPSLQRRCACGGTPGPGGECAECRARRLGRRAGRPATIPPLVHEVLGSPGIPLDATTRAFMEPRFGHDFGRVLVQAAESVTAVNALAHMVQPEQGAMDLPGHTGLGPVGEPLEQEAAATRVTSARARVSGSRAILQRAAVGSDGPDPADRGGTLPYGEATELLECIRIMGQENAAYCRQEVLGEQPQPIPPPPPCSPTGLTRDRYLAQPGATTNDFGLTTLSGTVTVPTVHTTRMSGGVRLDETDAALPPITSVFTDADTFTEGTSIFTSQGGDCPSGRYPIRWTIFPDGARKIREAELEHCADFRYAFEISLKRYADAVNRLALSGRTFPSQRAAEAHVSRLVGAQPANWSSIFECLARKTQRRDGQSGFRGSHTPRPMMREPRLETSCAFTRAVISGSSLPEVGQHPPSEIIKDCGEGGTQGGARGAAQ